MIGILNRSSPSSSAQHGGGTFLSPTSLQLPPPWTLKHPRLTPSSLWWNKLNVSKDTDPSPIESPFCLRASRLRRLNSLSQSSLFRISYNSFSDSSLTLFFASDLTFSIRCCRFCDMDSVMMIEAFLDAMLLYTDNDDDRDRVMVNDDEHIKAMAVWQWCR